jgi:hypothetical protein
VRSIIIGLAFALGTPLVVSAQTPLVVSKEGGSPPFVSGEGFEAFNVEYQGGDATHSKKRWGMLVITDSTVGFYECLWSGCLADKKKSMIKEPPIWLIPLEYVKEVSSSNQVRGATVGGKLMWGSLAGDRTEEFVGLVYESETNAEAPIFKTRTAQSGAVEAKIRFRLKRKGISISPPPLQ